MNFFFLIFLTDINECDPNPCQNEGTCVDGIDSYTCTCVAGYTGINCETSEYTLKRYDKNKYSFVFAVKILFEETAILYRSMK